MSNDTTAYNTNMSISITPSAVGQLKKLMAEQKKENLFLRLGVAAGGCSGMSYTLAFDDEKNDADLSFEFDGLTAVVDEQSLAHIGGSVIDYKSDLMGGGFSFSNPNASRSCGCGSSFSC